MRKAKKPPPDWVQIKADFCGNAKSIRELARWHKLSEAAIRKHAKREGWKRNPLKGTQRQPVRTGGALPTLSPSIVAAAADPEYAMNLGVGLVTDLLLEIRFATTNREELQELILERTQGSERQRQTLLRTTTAGARVVATRHAMMALRAAMESKAPAGKKGKAAEAARQAGSSPDDDWGEDLFFGSSGTPN
jgi:hypothetical protein